MAVISWRIFGVATLMLASGCATQVATLSTVANRIKPSYWTRAPVEGQPPKTAEPGSLLRLTFAEGRSSALAAKITARPGGETFSTTDPITFTLRSARLVETRGLPGDLMSAEPGPELASLVSGDHYTRRWQVIGADDLIEDIRLTCTAEVAVVAGERRIKERCSREALCIVNQFVMISPHSLIWSRQWIGPKAGYALIQRPDQPAPRLPVPPCEGGTDRQIAFAERVR